MVGLGGAGRAKSDASSLEDASGCSVERPAVSAGCLRLFSCYEKRRRPGSVTLIIFIYQGGGQVKGNLVESGPGRFSFSARMGNKLGKGFVMGGYVLGLDLGPSSVGWAAKKSPRTWVTCAVAVARRRCLRILLIVKHAGRDQLH